ncbi:MAG: aldehyde dehydrogenase family protein [Actinomycetota bacterium]|nr:aldehyde dehydrogenase family protein [Actinomycetota bacterium]
MSRSAVIKTNKLFIDGSFVRSESGQTFTIAGDRYPRASRKDVRDAVRAARAGYARWSGLTPYNRGQVLYRLAEMLETRRDRLEATCSGSEEVDRCIDRVVWYAGWPDKLTQVLGSSNAVAGPYLNYTAAEPMGVVGIVAPTDPPLEGFLSRLAAVLAAGNAAVVLAGEPSAAAVMVLAEAVATSDLPAGAANLLTGPTTDTAKVLAAHLDIDALDLGTAADPGELAELERLAAGGITRVVRQGATEQSLRCLSAFVEHKTVWHPRGI